jgi:hypothetical protein
MVFISGQFGVAAKVCGFFLLVQLAWLVGCQESNAPATGNVRRIEEILVLSNRLRQFAGEGATDCGSVGLGQEPDTASSCALKIHADGKPFYVSYKVQGIDTQIAIGFAADATGNAYALEYDSGGWSSEGLGKNLQLSDGNHITIERCAKPVNLRKARSGRITCFLRDL